MCLGAVYALVSSPVVRGGCWDGTGLDILCLLALLSELNPALRSRPSRQSRAPASAHHGFLSRPSEAVRAWPASTGGRRCGRSWEGKT